MPSGELSEPLLPRWFVLTALAVTVVAVLVVVAALVGTSGSQNRGPVAARRPPPAEELTHAVGSLDAGETSRARADASCELFAGARVAGGPRDREHLRLGLEALCGTDLPGSARSALRRFAEDGGTVGFARFGDASVASTGRPASANGDTGPVIYLNERYSTTAPATLTAPLVHDAVTLAGEPGTVGTALRARRAEAAVCEAVDAAGLGSDCADARELLDLQDPRAALRRAGYEEG